MCCNISLEKFYINDMKKGGEKMKKKSIAIIVLLLLVGLTSGYVSSTYAKYVKTLDNAEATTTIAKWDFKKGTNYGVFEISLPATVDPTTLVANRIAPGTSGTFTIDLDNSGSEVGVQYEIAFATATGVPSNLVFKQNSTTLNVAGSKVVGTIPAGQSDSIALDWEWPYETSGTLATEDGEDTTNGEAATRTMTLTATVNGHQVAPSATATTKTYTLQAAS